MTEQLVTTTGQILFMAAKNPVKDYSGEKKIYSIRMLFDGTSAEGLKLRNQIENINAKKIVTNDKRITKAGDFVVAFSSTYAPKVMDAQGSLLELEHIPHFNGNTDKGTAKVIANISTKGKVPTLYLNAIQLIDLELSEKDSTTTEGIEEKLRKSFASSN